MPIQLIPRFYDVTGGAVRLGEHDIRDLRLQDVRSHIAFVHQESLMLPTTVAENISYGRPDATLDEIIEAARMAGAHQFITELPEGYATALGDHARLSGGQRQRIAIARALLTQAPILVLDEPTSALDPEQETLIGEVLAGFKGQRTVILISHRLSTVERCDRVCVLENGQIAESGGPEDLHQAGGIYRKLFFPNAEIPGPLKWA